MSYYGYQYKQQCYIPSTVKCTTPVFTQCHHPGAVQCVPCTPCASQGPKLCTVRKTIASTPKCFAPCPPRCMETHVVEGHSSSCTPVPSQPCTAVYPQSYVQGSEHHCTSHCGQRSCVRCPKVCAPAPVCQNTSYPYSFQWSDSYHYNCGPQ